MLTADSISCRYYIKNYQDNKIELIESNKVQNSLTQTSTFYVSYEKLEPHCQVSTFDELSIEQIMTFDSIDMLIIGTGISHQFPQAELYKQLESIPFSIDFMSNSAACRTFNVLANEERKVGALFFIET